MYKIFIRLFFLILTAIILTSAYISYFGIETDKFDNVIKEKVNTVNRYTALEFKKTKIYFNPFELDLVVKLQNPKILIKNNELILSKLHLFLPIKSFFNSDVLLKKAEIAFIENDIKDLTKITKVYLPKIINKRVNKIFSKGTISGEFTIPFSPNGNLENNYNFSGKIKNATLNLTSDFAIKNLTTEIIQKKNKNNKDLIEIKIKKGFIYDINLAESLISLNLDKGSTNIKSTIKTVGKINDKQIKKISSLLLIKTNYLEKINGNFDLITLVNFDLKSLFNVKNLSYSSEGEISYLEAKILKKKIFKKYLPDYDSNIIIKNAKVKVANNKKKRFFDINGLAKIKNNFDSFKINTIYDYKKDISNINGTVNLTNSKISISQLNYIKNEGKKSDLEFEANFISNKYYNINKFKFLSGNDKIILSNLKLNRNLEINNFNKIEIVTYVNELKNNDLVIEKKKIISVYGDVFDAGPLLKTLFKKKKGNTFSKKFSSDIKINFKKAITGPNDNLADIGMIASIQNGSFDKLSMKGNFSEQEIIEMSLYQIDNEKKTFQLISDRAKPFIENFEFIKGFEDGNLVYESTIFKDKSESTLVISEFKVSKVPALAQLLTLASLQGIADTLGGEGIRFESFEMKSNTKGNVMNIVDALAIGPAVSILLNGYVDKGKLVSLRGTLVPATKLNEIIASIPVVGKILVGKKTGEGVVGVSFKMKGHPKDIKTTVNPIKTLTPRFIVRAVEKMKKTKKEESK
jgi:hypothetical protein